MRPLLILLLLAGCGDSNDGGTSPADMEPDVATDAGHDAARDISTDNGADPDLVTDVGEMDTADGDVPENDAPAQCPLGDLPDEDRARLILVGQPFAEEVGVKGTEIRTLELGRDGLVTDTNQRLDVGVVPSRIEFSPNGAFAFVLGTDGGLVTVEVSPELRVVDSLELPSADYGDLRMHPDGRTLTVVGSNVAETGGVSVVDISCDPETLGHLTELPHGFLNLRLTDSLAPLGQGRAVLLGGQAAFEPEDAHDIRLLAFADRAWKETAAFDIFSDHVGATRIAANPDGTQVLVPNDVIFSEEGGQVAVLSVVGDTISEQQRVEDLPDVTEALYSPDGHVALVAQAEPGRIRVLETHDDGVTLTQQEIRVGVAKQMAPVTRGPLRGLVLIPATSPADGPELVVLQIDGTSVTETQRLSLNRGFINIPGPIAVQP